MTDVFVFLNDKEVLHQLNLQYILKSYSILYRYIEVRLSDGAVYLARTLSLEIECEYWNSQLLRLSPSIASLIMSVAYGPPLLSFLLTAPSLSPALM